MKKKIRTPENTNKIYIKYGEKSDTINLKLLHPFIYLFTSTAIPTQGHRGAGV